MTLFSLRHISRRHFGLSVGAILLSTLSATAAERTYISLGDSVGYGITSIAESSTPSFGDRGYAKPFADWLGARDGERPNVINLSIPGESSSSFFDTSEQFYRPLNLNYNNSPLSQSQMLSARVAEEQAAGRIVSNISITMGPNDMFEVVDMPGFFSLPPAEQQARLFEGVARLQVNYAAILTQIRMLAPTADVMIIGHYNPFAAVPNSDYAMFAPLFIGALNQVAFDTAQAFDARFIDIFDTFLGREVELTHILNDPGPGDNVHPTTAGYMAIAGLMVPAPAGAFVMIFAGVLCPRRSRIVA